MELTKTCPKCGRVFTTAKSAQKFCSQVCAKDSQRERNKAYMEGYNQRQREKRAAEKAAEKAAKEKAMEKHKKLTKPEPVVKIKPEKVVKQAPPKVKKKRGRPRKITKSRGFYLLPDMIQAPQLEELSFEEKYKRSKDAMSKESLIAKEAGMSYGEWQGLKYMNYTRWKKMRDFILADANLGEG